MNRRNFLQTGSLAILAAAGLPKAIKKIKANTPYKYVSDLVTGKAGQTQYTVTIFHEGVQKFATALPEEKFISLTVDYYETADHYKAAKRSQFKLLIESAELIDKENHIWRVKTKTDKKVSGDHEFSSDFPKDMKFLIKLYAYADILSKKDKSLSTLKYVKTYVDDDDEDYDSDCFLTTACVNHKKLPDNCNELETLRSLRDHYMLKNKEGVSLVNEYELIGPGIVSSINNCENKGDIYEYLYQHLVQPSVEMIKQGRPADAVEYYAVFVNTLKKNY